MFQVPTQIIGDQAVKTASLYREDTDGNRAKLRAIGITEEKVRRLEQLGKELCSVEVSQEMIKTDAVLETSQATSAVQMIIDWRKYEVLPRVKLALGDDKRIKYFRVDKLRSRRSATVLREARLLIASLKRFAHLSEMQLRGVNAELIAKGEALLAQAEVEDTEAVQANAAQLIATQQVHYMVSELSDMLQEIERAAAVVFPSDSAEQRRYALSRIRNYLAVQRGKNRASAVAQDSTAELPVAAQEESPLPALKAS